VKGRYWLLDVADYLTEEELKLLNKSKT